MRFLLIALLLAACRKSEPEREPLQIDPPSGGPGWQDDKKLAASLAKLDKLKARDGNRAAIMPPEMRARPAASPPPMAAPAPRFTVVGDPPPPASDEPRRKPAQPHAEATGDVVYCEFMYFKKTEVKAENITGQSLPMRMKDSFCTNGSVADATERCNRDTRQRFNEDIPCACTSDPNYIGDRCKR